MSTCPSLPRVPRRTAARTLQRPVTPVRAIITTENIESLARVGLLSPVSIVLATSASSIVITAAVSTSVP